MNNNTCLSLLLLLAGLPGNSQATIGGSVACTGHPNPVLYLSSLHTYPELLSREGVPVVDSAAIGPDGRFAFPPANRQRGVYRLHIQPADRTAAGSDIRLGTPDENYLHLFIAGSTDTITVTADGAALYRSYQVRGNPECRLFEHIRNARLPFLQTLDSCWALLERQPVSLDNDDATVRTAVLEATQRAALQVQYALLAFLDSTANPYAGLLAAAYYQLGPTVGPGPGWLENQLTPWRGLDTSDTVLRSFTQILQTPQKQPPAGALFPDLVLTDPDGHALYLSEIQAKLMLVHFWSTGCKHCRAINHTLLKPLYHQYRHQGLRVLSIASDNHPGRWRRIIANGRLDWLHGARRSSPGAPDAYPLGTHPETFLLDAEGRLLAQNLPLKNLAAFIEAYLESN